MTRPPTRPARPGFWVLDHAVNPVVRALLRSPWGGRFGRSLVLVDYRGRRSGRARHLVAHAERLDDERLRITVGAADRKAWWRNFATAWPITLWIAGVAHDGTATAVEAEGRTTVVCRVRPRGEPVRRP